MDTLDNLTQFPIYFSPGCKLLQLEHKMTSKVYDYLHKPYLLRSVIRALKYTAIRMPICICEISGKYTTNISPSTL